MYLLHMSMNMNEYDMYMIEYSMLKLPHAPQLPNLRTIELNSQKPYRYLIGQSLLPHRKNIQIFEKFSKFGKCEVTLSNAEVPKR